jgi:hypothetical protein
LQFNGVDFSWWDDRNGDAQYFWSGSNTSKHICQCGIDRNCVESHAMCNCDSVFQKPLNDSGKYFFKKIHILVVPFHYTKYKPLRSYHRQKYSANYAPSLRENYAQQFVWRVYTWPVRMFGKSGS